MLTLDDQIQAAELRREAELRQAAALQDLLPMYIPVVINGQLYWLTRLPPAPIQAVLDHLPKDREDADIPRPRQIKARLSEDEWAAFDALVKASGLPQGEYIRGMVLNGSIAVTQTSLVDSKALDTLVALAAEIGKISGMIRKTIIVNHEFAILDAQGKACLERCIRSLRPLQSKLQALAEEIHGNLQA